jgi:hypothetical protein
MRPRGARLRKGRWIRRRRANPFCRKDNKRNSVFNNMWNKEGDKRREGLTWKWIFK